MTQYRVVGTRPVRPDGSDKVTGRAVYGADVYLPGMLHGKVLYSPYAHARIKSIDVSAALAMEGVLAVVTGADLPPMTTDEIVQLGESAIGTRYMRDMILARDKALYQGHAIAAVAATSIHLAEMAVSAIKVEYEVLPPVLDVEYAMRPEAPLLHEDLTTRSLGQATGRHSNIASHMRAERGSVEAGFAEAHVVVEREFRTTMVHQGYIEPHAATAQVTADGHYTVWTTTQGSFAVRNCVSQVCGIPLGKLRVIPTEIGGGFGGKTQTYLAPLAVLLTRKSGRPVKLVMTRAETFRSTGPTSGAYIRLKAGARRDGTITALAGSMAYEAGAFPGSPVGAAVNVCFTPYKTDNLRVDGYDVVVNKPRTQAYRAPGATNIAFAAESVIDELAEKLGMDPLAFRLKNAVREGDLNTWNAKLPVIGLVQLLRAAMESEHYSAPLSGQNRGRGVAAGFWGNWGAVSSVHMVFNHDGSINVVEGSVDIAGSRASMAMLVAEELGIPFDQVNVTIGDTEMVGFANETGGSRTTYATGWACVKAAQNAIDNLRGRAALMWECATDQVEYIPGKGFISTADAEKLLTLREICAKMNATGGPVYGVATINAGGGAPAFAVHIADVEVDAETGKVDILRYTALQDVGTAIHPAYVEGQIQGGATQGIGWALHEGYVYDEQGNLKNANFLDYRIPTALDVPMIDTVMVEVPAPNHPYGVRGVGEACIVPPAGALANAIHRAVGVRLPNLPMTPEQVCMALVAKAEAK